MSKQKILFVCTHNSARSQLAEGLLNALAGDRFEVYSCGTEPSQVNPYVVRALAEIGIDVSKQYSKHCQEFKNIDIDLVITVCDNAKETCPVFSGAKKYLHQSFPDPSAVTGSEMEKLVAFCRVRDEILIFLNTKLTIN